MKRYLLFGSFNLLACILVMLAATAPVAAQQSGIKGKVRTNSGSAISNATITITKDGNDLKSTSTASDGAFQIVGVNPGFYGLRVEAQGYASGSLFSVEVKKNKVRDLGDKLFLRVDQGTQVILRGSVFFKEGTSVTAAKVELERIDAEGKAKEVGSTFSSVSGEFVFRQPQGAARYRVKVKYNGTTATKEIEVENAAVYRLAITLELSSKDK